MKALFTHDTILKKNSVAPASGVPSSHKLAVSKGFEIEYLAFNDAGDSHWTVTFADELGPQNWNTWNVFKNHIDLRIDTAPKFDGRCVSDVGIELITRYEGFRSNAYLCPAGVWTIGYGSTRGVKQGDTITREAAIARFRKELLIYEKGVLDLLKTPANQNQFDAMVSLAYNIGVGAFNRSSVLRFHNQSIFGEAANSFLMWNKGGGQVLPGLVRRREEERKLYLTPDLSAPQMDAKRPPDEAPKPAPNRPKSPIAIPGIGVVDAYSEIVEGIPLFWYEAVHYNTSTKQARIPTAAHARNIIALAREVGKAREQIGKPFRVTSWYRPEPWNSRAGGASRSQHLEGKGIDIAVEGETGRSLAQKLSWWRGGMGIYRSLPHIIHLDNRPGVARWGI